MNNDKVTVSKYIWVATAVAFLLIFGSIWFASSLGSNGVSAEASKPDVSGRGSEDRVYTDRVAPEPPVPVVNSPSLADPMAPLPKRSECIPQAKRAEKKITPRDMFPVGDITRDMPRFSHPFRQIAELFPSFAYESRVWTSTGRYVHNWEADLAPTGFSLATGQTLFALANTAAPDAVLFVQSTMDPSKFAVYRRL